MLKKKLARSQYPYYTLAMQGTRKTLARKSAAQSERLLMELANLGDEGLQRFIRRYGNVVPPQELPAGPQREDFEETKKMWNAVVGMDWREMEVRELRDLIRRAWKETDSRTKDYLLFLLQQRDIAGQIPGFEFIDSTASLPPPSQFEQALMHLRSCGNLARYCANPNCAITPYFIAKRKSQKYCSEMCALPAQREFKRQWWAEHGEQWRASKRAKSTSKKGGK